MRTFAWGGTLVASPQAIVWARGAPEQTIVFDPDTGRGLWWLEPATGASLHGTQLLVRRDAIVQLLDVTTRELLDRVELAPGTDQEASRVRDGDVVLDGDGGGYIHTSALGVVEARRLEPGGARSVWRRELPISHGVAGGGLFVGVAREHGAEALALARESGETRWQAPGSPYAADAEGVVLWERPERLQDGNTYALRRPDGSLAWRRPVGGLARVCLGPRVVVEALLRTILVIDRASGEERTRFDVPSGPPGPGDVVLVGDAILHWPERGLLRACDHDGRERWRLQLDAHAVTGSGPVAVTPGRLLVASADHLVCIDESP